MEFFISNPVISFTLFILLGFVMYMATKLFDEIVLNKALKIKHQQMRINVAIKGIKARVTGLTVATLVPMSIIVAFVVVGANTTIEENKDLLSINSSSDILSIYEDFNEKLSNSNDSWFGRNSVDMLTGAPEMAIDDVANEILYTMDGSQGSDDYSETNNQVVGVDEMDNVLTDGKFIYTMYGSTVQISLAGIMVDGEFDASMLQLYKTFEYSTEICADEQFYPQGMFVDEDQLIVIGNQYNYYCDDKIYDNIRYSK